MVCSAGAVPEGVRLRRKLALFAEAFRDCDLGVSFGASG